MIILLSGIAGIGKSTYAQNLSKTSDIKIISTDALREKLLGNEADQSLNHTLFTRILPDKIEDYLDLYGKVIIDMTSTTLKSRKMPIAIAKDKKIQIHCHYFKPDVEKAWRQNNLRARVVPLFVIENQARQWQVPSLAEGFDKIVEL